MKKNLHIILLKSREYKQVIITLIILTIIGDISLINFKSDLITFIILGLLVASFNFYKFPFRRIFVLCLMPVVIIFFGFIINPYSVIVEKAAIWLFLLLGVGIIQQLFNKEKK